MPKEKLISIKDASLKSGIAEETIIKQLKSGQIRGEKKNYLLWDEWFVTMKEVGKLRPAVTAGQAQATELQSKSMLGDDRKPATTSATMVADVDSKNEREVFSQNHSGNHNSEVTKELATEIDRAFGPNTFAEAFGPQAVEASLAVESSDAPGQLAVIEKDAASNEQPTENVDRPNPEAWQEYRQRAKTVAEEFLTPLLARLEIQANLLREKDVVIAEQAAQLRLLPDYQRQTEESALLAQAKEKEAFELRQNLMWERKKALIKLSSWQMKHVRQQKQIKEVTDELEALQEEKESEVNYLHCQLTELQNQLTEVQKPWWKKVFRGNQP